MKKDEIIESCKKFIEDHNDLTTSLIKEYGSEYGLSKGIISYNFGTLKNLREELGVEYKNRNFSKLSEIDKCEFEKDVLNFLNKYAPNKANINKYGKLYNISMSKICYIYGSLSEMKKSLGLTVNKNKYSKDEIVEKLIKIHQTHGHISKELLDKVDKSLYVNSKTIYRIWGSFKNMYKELFPELYSNNIFSSGELLVSHILSELNIEFETQKKFNFSNNYKYDFYIPSKNTVIEYHGIQHYEFVKLFHKTESVFLYKQNIDKNKKQMVIDNNINYIEIPYHLSKNDIILKLKILQ